jgi:hypothetical protein
VKAVDQKVLVVHNVQKCVYTEPTKAAYKKPCWQEGTVCLSAVFEVISCCAELGKSTGIEESRLKTIAVQYVLSYF